MAQLKNTTINDDSNLTLPVGTTAQRPGSPAAGMIRYNTTINDTEYYDGGAWRPISDSNPEATGGTIVDTDIGGVPYRIHLFTNTGNSTFSVTKGGTVEYLIVAGGGAGGSADDIDGGGGGGGAGGVLQGFTTVTPQNYSITVGVGPAGNPNNSRSRGQSGGNSSAFGETAIGGGGGGSVSVAGASGGSGGGGARSLSAGSGTAGQGNSGGINSVPNSGGGGGGGAGSAGKDGNTNPGGGEGGQGIVSTITGTAQWYAGGGGGGTDAAGVGGLGGLGGGGRGGNNNQSGFDAAANTGGGGGGAGTATALAASQSNGSPSGDGGSGIVVVRYRRNATTATTPSRTAVSVQPNTFLNTRSDLVVDLDLSFYRNSDQIVDLSGNGNNGVIVNAPSYGQNSLTLNGTDQRITIPFNPQFNAQTLTIEYVVQPLQKTHVRPFVNRSGTSSTRPWRILMVNPSGEFIAFILVINDTTYNVNSDSAFSTNDTITIHAVYDGSEQSMWIDGVKQQATNTVTGTINAEQTDIEIGRNESYDPDRYASQRTFAFKFYERALTPREIALNVDYNRRRFIGF